MNCRFIHPGVNDKGNYSLITKTEPFPPNGAPPLGPHPLMPANPWVSELFGCYQMGYLSSESRAEDKCLPYRKGILYLRVKEHLFRASCACVEVALDVLGHVGGWAGEPVVW